MKIEYEVRKIEAKNFIVTEHLKKEKASIEQREKDLFHREQKVEVNHIKEDYLNVELQRLQEKQVEFKAMIGVV